MWRHSTITGSVSVQEAEDARHEPAPSILKSQKSQVQAVNHDQCSRKRLKGSHLVQLNRCSLSTYPVIRYCITAGLTGMTYLEPGRADPWGQGLSLRHCHAREPQPTNQHSNHIYQMKSTWLRKKVPSRFMSMKEQKLQGVIVVFVVCNRVLLYIPRLRPHSHHVSTCTVLRLQMCTTTHGSQHAKHMETLLSSYKKKKY